MPDPTALLMGALIGACTTGVSMLLLIVQRLARLEAQVTLLVNNRIRRDEA